MTSYIFQLGREAQLSLAELAAVLPAGTHVIDGTETTAIVQAQDPLDLPSLQERLGGTVKIAEALAYPLDHLDETLLTQMLIDEIKACHVRNIGISLFGTNWTADRRNRFGLTLKKALKELGSSIRFIIHDDLVLSSVIVGRELLNDGREFLCVETNRHFFIGTTRSVQPWGAWSERDYDRPARDPKRGMLPPKLARIMLNLAQANPTQRLLDPFCGTGTVLMEAALLGLPHLLGSDIDAKAMEETTANLEWLRDQFPQVSAVEVDLFHAPIEHVASLIEQPVDRIVSEADLGPTNFKHISGGERKRRIGELRHHYRRWFKDLHGLLTDPGVAILACPILLEPETDLDLLALTKETGWQLDDLWPRAWQSHPALQGQSPRLATYARPDQLIGRQIIRMKKALISS